MHLRHHSCTDKKLILNSIIIFKCNKEIRKVISVRVIKLDKTEKFYQLMLSDTIEHGSCIQYPVRKHSGKEEEKEYVHIYN